MIVFHGSMRVAPGKRSEFVEKLIEADLASQFRQEPGNVFYTLAMSAEDEDVVVTCDAWDTNEEFEAHTKSEACAQFMKLHDKFVVDDSKPFIFEF